jgi:hypothetical protein
VTADELRRLALSLPEASEQSHMGHPDFRVGRRIFATLAWPDEGWGMVKLTHEQQDAFVASAPEAFSPVPGGWGRRGATRVLLARADPGRVYEALALAWRNVAPKRLVALHDRL